MDPNRKITKKFTKNFDSTVVNGQFFHRKTGLESILLEITFDEPLNQCH